MPPQSSQPTGSAAQPTRSSTSGSGGLTSPAGSPPLILAFLAIGIFSAAMIAVFGWRRVQFPREGSRGFVHDGFERRFNARNGSNGGSGTSSRFGEKPVLWELQTDRKSKIDAVDYGTWDNIMPLAVAPTSHGPSSPRRQDSLSDTRSQTRAPVGVVTTSPLSAPMLIYSLLGPRPWATSNNETPPSPSSDNQRSFSSRPRRQQNNSTPTRAHIPTPFSLLWRHRRRAGGGDQGNPDGPTRLRVIGHEGSGDEVRTETRHEENGRKEIQVAVIIEMPSLAASALRQRQWRRSFYSSSLDQSDMRADMEEEGEEGDQAEFQYCIGVHAGPWPVAGAGSTGAKDTTAASVGNSLPERIASPGEREVIYDRS